MIFVDKDNTQVTDPFPAFNMRTLVTKDQGTVSLSVNNVGLKPASGIAPHIHATHEEAIVVLGCSLVFMLGEATRTVGPSNTILAPARIKHNMFNLSGKKGRAITIFPITSPKHTLRCDMPTGNLTCA